jgi:signal transduction histidine kinase
MTPEPEVIGSQPKMPLLAGSQIREHSDAVESGLLLQAFEMFTQASNSLESAFGQLQLQVQRLTEELEAKNLELEKSLREKEEAQSYLRTILERLPCGVVVLDQNGDLALCNPMASEALKQSRARSNKREKGGRPVLSAEMRNCLTTSASNIGHKKEVEISVVNNDKKRILATSGTHFTDAGGHQIGTLHIIRDITEVKALQEQGKRVERLSAMGEMAVELAHEIRNPLGSVELFTSLLVKELSGDPKRWAENIRIGTRTLNTIVSNMLHFANPISPAFSEVNVHQIIEELLRFSEPIMRQREVHVETNLKAENPIMQADPELLKQMMLNLIFNAMKAMPSQGALTISTRTIESKNGDGRLPEFELQIRDSGIGIPPENLSRIFDPFFTTNKNGTGLGLSVVHQIVERHGGRIRVSSEVNRGTIFTILFGSKSGKE